MSSLIRDRIERKALALAKEEGGRLLEDRAEVIAKRLNVKIEVVKLARDLLQDERIR